MSLARLARTAHSAAELLLNAKTKIDNRRLADDLADLREAIILRGVAA